MAGRAKSNREHKRPANRSQPRKSAAASASAAEPPAPVAVSHTVRKRALGEIVGGSAIILASWIATLLGYSSESKATGKFVLVFGPLFLGLAAIVSGAIRLTRRSKPDPSLPPQPDPRRWIYGGLGVAFACGHAFALVAVIPNRLPTAWVHLWSFPLLTLAMAAGTLLRSRVGWWISVLAGSALIASVVFVIARILASAAFLAGTYGAFGKAASTFSLVAVALIINAVALLPIVQIKWLMSRAGRRAYGV